MGGIGSGRRPIGDEEKRYRIIDKAWDVIEEALNNSSLSFLNKVEIAAKIVVKNIPTELMGEVKGTENQIVIIRPEHREATIQTDTVSR